MNLTVNTKKFRFRDLFSILKDAFRDWNDDDSFTHAAAVSYYAIFSLPAIIIILVKAAGILLGKEIIQKKLTETIGTVIGENSAQQFQKMAESSLTQAHSKVMVVIGTIVLIITATGFFIQLQKALNRMWEVKTKEDAGILKVIFDRTKTFGIILAVGFLLLISSVITGLLTTLSSWAASKLPDIIVYLFHAANFIISLGVITCLFALIFKFLPDVRIEFRTVWVGACVTAFLFLVGQYGLAIYFSLAKPASAYGVAGSIILILLWVYYSCLLLFFGAEFTQSYALKYGHHIEPSNTAVKIEPCIPLDPNSYKTK